MNGDVGAGFGVGDGVVVVGEVVSASGGYCGEFVVGECAAECTACRLACAVESVSGGVLHSVCRKCGAQAPFVEAAEVGYQGQAVDVGRKFRPHFGEGGGFYGVVVCEAVYAGVVLGIPIRCRPY